MKNVRFLGSFNHAFRGFYFLFWEESNFRIQLFISLIVIFLGFYFHLEFNEWIWIIQAICLVFAAEAINTAIERTVNLRTKKFHLSAKHAKDFSAASVLIISFYAIVVGFFIFYPHLNNLIS